MDGPGSPSPWGPESAGIQPGAGRGVARPGPGQPGFAERGENGVRRAVRFDRLGWGLDGQAGRQVERQDFGHSLVAAAGIGRVIRFCKNGPGAGFALQFCQDMGRVPAAHQQVAASPAQVGIECLQPGVKESQPLFTGIRRAQ